jgi:DNA polymerase type B, organellar and viral
MKKWEFNLNGQILTSQKLSMITSLFINENHKQLINKNNIFAIQLKIVIYEENLYRSITKIKIVDYDNFNSLVDYFIGRWNVVNSTYKELNLDKIIIEYKVYKRNNFPKGFKSKPLQLNNLKNNFKLDMPNKELNIPKTMDLTKWGNVQYNWNKTEATILLDKNQKYNIYIYSNYNKVDYIYNNIIIESFIDTLINSKNNLSTFKRNIENKEYNYINGKLDFCIINKETKFLQRINSVNKIESKFITMDLETRSIPITDKKSKMEVICLSYFDGLLTKSFYITDFENQKQLLNKAISSILIRKYTGYKVYFHNFSNFDAIFILSILSDLSNKIEPVIRDGRYINIKLYYGPNNKYVISFRDSMLLLPSSLKKLSNSFNDTEIKGIFPYDFVNNIALNYIGKIPEFEYFSNTINLDKYDELDKEDKEFVDQYIEYNNKFKNKTWDLRHELIKYCELDVISLWQVINNFQKLIYKNFSQDILNWPTLSSLAFAIYRSNFLDNKANIPIVLGKIYDNIKLAYTGGSVDVYKPYGRNIYRYDVNSLYPSQMLKQDMPIGYPTYFEGNIFKHVDKPFGFFNCKITTPDNLNEPILQLRFKLNNSIRTIAPLGTWEGMYFSEEINNAIKYGYKIEVLSGYLFEKKNIFNDYVEYLYKLKSNSKKGTPMYTISKLLLNSLYGRFGMSPEMSKHLIINNDELDNYLLDGTLLDFDQLENKKYLISIKNTKKNKSDDFYNKINISVPIAAAITAYSRIHMSNFKNNPCFNLYYSDTDSIDINKKLSEQFIGTELGKMKFENEFKEVVYLAPKVYGWINNENKKKKKK